MKKKEETMQGNLKFSEIVSDDDDKTTIMEIMSVMDNRCRTDWTAKRGRVRALSC